MDGLSDMASNQKCPKSQWLDVPSHMWLFLINQSALFQHSIHSYTILEFVYYIASWCNLKAPSVVAFRDDWLIFP